MHLAISVYASEFAIKIADIAKVMRHVESRALSLVPECEIANR